MSKNNNFPLKEIDEVLGIKPKGEEYYLLRKQSNLSIAKTEEIIKRLDEQAKSGAITASEVMLIKEWLETFKVTIPKEFDVKVLNQVKIPDNIEINNLPEAWDIKEPNWLNKLTNPIVKELKAIKELNPDDLRLALEQHTDPLNPIAVRLSDGTQFIKAIGELKQVMQGSTVDEATKAILRDILAAVGGTPAVGVIVRKYGEVSGVAATQTVITSYTVPSGKTFTLSDVTGSACTDGEWALYVNGSEIWKAYNAWTDRNVDTTISYGAVAGDVIELRVTNKRTITQLFNGGFNGVEI